MHETPRGDIPDMLPVGVFLSDPKGDYISVNEAWCEVAGMRAEAALGEGWLQAVHPHELAAVATSWRAAAEGGRNWEYEYRFRHSDGTSRRVLCRAAARRDESGGTVGYVGAVTDVTNLRQREERLALALGASNDGLYDTDLRTGAVYFSPRYYSMLGYAPGEFPASWESFATLVQPDDMRSIDTIMLGYAENRWDRHEIEIRMKARGGDWRWILSRGQVVERDEAGHPVRLVGTHVDITDRKRTEEDLRVKDKAIATAINGIAITDANAVLSYVNPAFLRMWGYDSESEVIGRSVLSLANNLENAKSMIRELAEKGSWIGELVAWKKDGTLFEVQVAGNLVTDQTGVPILMMGSFVDVSESARRGRALRESEERLRTLVTNAPVVLFALDKHGAFTLSEGKSLSVLNLKPGEAVGQSVFDLYRGNEAVLAPVGRALAGVSSKAAMRVGQSDFEVWLQPLTKEDGSSNGLIGVATDVTDRRKMEEERARLASLVENSRDFIGIATPEGRVTYLNPAAKGLVGLGDSTAPRTVFDFVDDDHRSQMTEDVMPALLTHGFWEGESALRNFQTGDSIPVELRAFALRNSEGQVTSIATVTRDATERRRAEQQRAKLEAQFLQAQKMEALGRLTGGIAHDFNNVLTVILGHTALLKSNPSVVGRIREGIEAIEQAGLRSGDLVRQLLGFSRQQIIAPQPLDVNRLLDESQKNLALLIGEDVELRFYPGTDLWRVRFDASQLGQVLMNLAVNARDAMPDGGRLTIETANVRLDETCSLDNADVTTGKYVKLVVSDTGAGMDRETMSHLFEPFFTTKPPGKGTGLGLATVYGIVRQNGGYLHADSEPGGGTTFKIYIPRLDDVTPIKEQGDQPGLVSGSGVILLVEDDEMVRNVTADALGSLGYTPLVAENPLHAIALCEDEANRIDLVLTDVVMPEMKGTELRGRLQAIRPGLKVLFMSGYASDVILRQGGVHFLPKPFGTEALAAKIGEVLGNQA